MATGDGSVGTILFLADSEANWPQRDAYASYATAYAMVRHEQLMEHFHKKTTLLLARLSLASGGVLRTFMFVEGFDEDPRVPPDIRWMIVDHHGLLTSSGVHEVAKVVGRNDRCPCLSGRKFKQCHGSPTAR